ncbi:MAG: class I SAM-dependent methyltransferase [Actinomycetota bacterium]
MRGYDESTYGDSFADVYDEWYRNVSRVDATVDRLRALGGDGPFLELGVGTGRLALPLAATGASVTGIDSSDAMLDKLTEKDPGGTVKVVRGDMVDDLPAGPFATVFVAYNTLFNLADPERQSALFHAVSTRLEVGGHFVVEAFVPDPQRPAGSTVTVRTMAADRLVLLADVHDPERQIVEGQFVEFTDDERVRLRPYRIRYSTPVELDRMARLAGLELQSRTEDMAGAPFDDDSPAHVSVYCRA